jgi:uncharacterized protein (TIGR03790 family)
MASSARKSRRSLMVWTAPYKVECNSITGAYTLGFDRAMPGPAPRPPEPVFQQIAGVAAVHTDLNLRLSMLLPTESVAQAKALIDRGASAGFTLAPATAYYLVTSGKTAQFARRLLPAARPHRGAQAVHQTLQADVLEGAQDVMIYQTGMAQVDKLETLRSCRARWPTT